MVAHDTRLSTTETEIASHQALIQDNKQSVAAHSAELVTVRTTISQNQARIANTEASLQQLQTEFEQLDLTVDTLASQFVHAQENIEKNSAGIAIANALAGSTWLQSNERVAFSANWGHFDGHDAVAFSGAARLGRNISANAAIGTLPDRGEIGARAGVRFGW